MKFLVKINLFLYLFLNILYCSDCLEIWFDKNFNNRNDILLLDLNVNNNQLKFFQYKDYIKINTRDYILLLDNQKTSKYIFKTNQLLIDNSDKRLKRYIKKITNFKKNIKKFKVKNKNKFSLKNNIGIDKMDLFFDSDCMNLDSVFVKDKNLELIINKIEISYLSNIHIDSIFVFDNLDDNVKKYDFSFEK